MKEIFKDIVGYESIYQVSNFGNVRSLDRAVRHKTGRTNTVKGRILKPRVYKNGYSCVGLYKRGAHKSFLVHRLVAIAFLDNPSNKPVVNHLDGDKLNNNFSNLEWATNAENISHAYKTKLNRAVKPSDVSSKNYKRKLTEQQAIEIKKLLVTGEYTHKEIATRFNIGRTTVTGINNGTTWAYV